MARPRHFPRTNSRSARLTQWIGPADQGYVTVASTTAVIIASTTFSDPLTIMRTRGMISVKSNVDTDVTITGAVGMAIVQNEALVAGVNSLPEPFSDADWGGWFVWRTFAIDQKVLSVSSIFQAQYNFEVDSKAMRKVTSNESLVVIAESQLGTFGLFDGTRVLAKLS